MNHITCKIDVTKISKERLFKGKKGTYLDVVLIGNKEPDQYGNDYMIVQSVTKEERDQGIKGPILGNAKVVGGQPKPTQPNPRPAPRPAPTTTEPDDDLDDVPF